MKELLPPILIATTDIEQHFFDHINGEHNIRILFSGAFGSGKTTFLNTFFNKQDSKYEVTRLMPVNYAVAQTDDIFELIKFDILFDLLEKGRIKDEAQFNRWLTLQVYLQEKGYNILKPLIERSHQVGKVITKVADQLYELIKEYHKFHKEMQVTNTADALAFLKSLQQKKGAPYETDELTGLIRKANEGIEKTTILLIDDLDRIDPEHIFRILNVFSAHFDPLAPDENKFGFDKIILVCDINNIRRVFHTRYGTEVDFTGYIDKFYSGRIFNFDMTGLVLEQTKNFLTSIHFDGRSTNILSVKRGGHIFRLLEYLLAELIYRRSVSLRHLKQLEKHGYTIHGSHLDPEVTNIRLKLNDYPIVAVIQFFVKLVGSLDELQRIIDALKGHKNNLDMHRPAFVSLMLPFLVIEHVGSDRARSGLSYTVPGSYVPHLSFNFKVEYNPEYQYYRATDFKEEDTGQLDVYDLIAEVILKIRQLKLNL